MPFNLNQLLWKATHRICQSALLLNAINYQVLRQPGFIYKLIPPYEKRAIPFCWLRPHWELHLFYEGERIYCCRLPARQMMLYLALIRTMNTCLHKIPACFGTERSFSQALPEESRLLTHTKKPFTQPVYPVPSQTLARIQANTNKINWLMLLGLVIAILLASVSYSQVKLFQLFQNGILSTPTPR
ncbi:hypothetical protein [Leptolyngbya sp. AN10]|uniref:hypothetical protein n=1 Tax=Leptolyngbya sp. AN10 TaxID=3423365 RepID=UPI003D318BA0